MNMKKVISLVLTVIMLITMSAAAFAQTVTATDGAGSITVSNAAKGETYKVVKIFDATVTGTEGGSIAYSGEIPEELEAYFEYTIADDPTSNIVRVEGVTDEALIAAVQAWAKTQNGTSVVSDGSALTFAGLAYGYYAVVTSQGAVVTIASTNPNATVVDKNSKELDAVKSANDKDVYIGDTVTYTLTFNTANYVGEGTAAKQVTKYEITDTLPDFLSDVAVTGITIGGEAYTVGGAVPQFDSNGKITIPWAENGTSIYNNGAVIVVTYTAKVTDKAVIDGAGNKNEVTLTPYVKDSENEKPWEETFKDDEVIYTYAALLQKVDENENPLAGAKFAANGLIVTGESGNYTVVSYDPDSTTPGTVMECDDFGKLVINGLASDAALIVTETEAPDGYNKLVNTETLNPTVTGKEVTTTITTIYYDAEGNVTSEETENTATKVVYPDALTGNSLIVVNQKGAELPETGAQGTKMIYMAGGILVAAAAVLLITKRRMNAAE